MKNQKDRLILAIAVAAVIVFAVPADAQRRASAQVGANCVGGFQALFDDIEAAPLSAVQESEVLYLREEEKLARDVYLTLAERWQLPIFSNIAAAEQRHMDLVLKVIQVYGLVDPVADDTVGVFTDTGLGALFGTLVADGETSLVGALRVGASIEDMDLADLSDLLAITDNDHLEIVAYNLAKGSRNHLRAFVRALEAQGETYAPQYLDQETFDAILEADVERRIFYDADGEPVPACGAEMGGFGIRRGNNDNGGSQGGPSGTGTGECDGNGSNDGGNGSGSGECDGSGSPGDGNGNGGGN